MEFSEDIKKVQLFLALRGVSNFTENGIGGVMNEETSLAIGNYLKRVHPNFTGSPSGGGAIQTILFDMYPLLNSSSEANTREIVLARNMTVHLQTLHTSIQVAFGSLSSSHSAFNPVKIAANNISHIQAYLNDILKTAQK